MNDDEPHVLTDLEIERVELVPEEEVEGFPGRVELVGEAEFEDTEGSA